MKSRFQFRNNGLGGQLLTDSDRMEITAEKGDEGEFFIRYKLIGGSSFNEDENEEGEAMQFVKDLLDSFERSE